MSIQADLKNYSDIRKLVSPASFTAAMGYWSWHNRSVNTAMLETWQALVVALAFEERAIDGLAFSAVKTFLDSHVDANPQTLTDCRKIAAELVRSVFPEV